jgi:hypothetical protein
LCPFAEIEAGCKLCLVLFAVVIVLKSDCTQHKGLMFN